MILNGKNVTLAEINKIYGARRKNFSEDRSMLSAAKCKPMILVDRNIKYMRIFAGVTLEIWRPVQEVRTLNMSFADVERAWRIYTWHMSLRAASHRVISYVQNQHQINAICLNSFRIKSAQSSARRREQN